MTGLSPATHKDSIASAMKTATLGRALQEPQFLATMPLAAWTLPNIGVPELRLLLYIRLLQDKNLREGKGRYAPIRLPRDKIRKDLNMSKSAYYKARKRCMENGLLTFETDEDGLQVVVFPTELGLPTGKGFLVIDDPDTLASGKKVTKQMVLMVLCWLVDNVEGYVHTYNQLLANMLKCSVSTIKRRLAELEEDGLIERNCTIIRKPIEGGDGSSRSFTPSTLRVIKLKVDPSKFYKLNHELSNNNINNTTTTRTRGGCEKESLKKKEILEKCKATKEGVGHSVKRLKIKWEALSEHQRHLIQQVAAATEKIYTTFTKPIKDRYAFIYIIFCKQLINNISRRVFSYRKDLSHALLREGYTSVLEGIKDPHGRLIDFYKEDPVWDGLNVSMEKALNKYSPKLVKYYKCPLDAIPPLLKNYEPPIMSAVLKAVYKEGIENMWNPTICILKIATKVMEETEEKSSHSLSMSLDSSVCGSKDIRNENKSQPKISLATREYIGNYLSNFASKSYFWSPDEGKLFKKSYLPFGYSWELSLAVSTESDDEEWKPYVAIYKELAGIK